MATARSDTKTRTVDVLIVGAGIAGTAFASFLLLAQLQSPSELRFRITILERSTSIQGHGQNIDIRGPGKDLLKKLGIDDDVRAATTGEEGAKFIDSAGKAWASFGVDKSGEVETGTGEIEILRGRLSKILFERCSALSGQVKRLGGDGVQFVFGESIDNIEQTKECAGKVKEGFGADIRVRFAKSREWREFDFIVGADGLQSRTRALAWTAGHDESKEGIAKQPQLHKEESPTENSLRQRTLFKGGVEASPSEYPKQDRQLGNTDQPNIVGSAQSSVQANADPHLRPLGVYNAFFSVPASLLSRPSGRSSTTENATKGTNNSDDVNDGWRRWYHAPGRKSVMLRPSDDSTRLTVLMIILDLEHSDSRLESVTTAKDDRKTAAIKQKELMREYFEDAGWECEKLVEGMLAANDFYYDLVAQVKMEQWSEDRVCLLGDAAYCASPFSGMGTTLALVGAYNLAGALTKQISSLTQCNLSSPPCATAEVLESSIPASSLNAAFADYESATRPIVTKAQQLPPGMPWLIHPQTAWGIWVMHYIVAAIWFSGLDKLLAKLAGRFKGKSKEDGLIQWCTK